MLVGFLYTVFSFQLGRFSLKGKKFLRVRSQADMVVESTLQWDLKGNIKSILNVF